MSRAKFEQWFNQRYMVSNEQGSHVKEMAYVAWLAGRESMRDEAAELMQLKHEELGLQHYRVAQQEILRIEP